MYDAVCLMSNMEFYYYIDDLVMICCVVGSGLHIHHNMYSEENTIILFPFFLKFIEMLQMR